MRPDVERERQPFDARAAGQRHQLEGQRRRKVVEAIETEVLNDFIAWLFPAPESPATTTNLANVIESTSVSR